MRCTIFALLICMQDRVTTSVQRPTIVQSTSCVVGVVKPVACENAIKLACQSEVSSFDICKDVLTTLLLLVRCLFYLSQRRIHDEGSIFSGRPSVWPSIIVRSLITVRLCLSSRVRFPTFTSPKCVDIFYRNSSELLITTST